MNSSLLGVRSRHLPFAPLPLALAVASFLAGCGGGSSDDPAARATASDAKPTAQVTSAAPEPAYAMSPGAYRLVSAASGQCVDAADGGALQQARCNQHATQRLSLDEQSPGVFTLATAASGDAA